MLLILFTLLLPLVLSQPPTQFLDKYRYLNEMMRKGQNEVLVIEVDHDKARSPRKAWFTVNGHEKNPAEWMELDELLKEGDEEDLKCCKLGTVAGTRGYHCYAKLYASKIIKLNENRPQNKRILFRGNHRPGLYGLNLIREFQLCIPRKSQKFNACCRLATKLEAAESRLNSRSTNSHQ